jgi:hypothetical protein
MVIVQMNFHKDKDFDQGRPTCGPEIFLCGPNWNKNLKKN